MHLKTLLALAAVLGILSLVALQHNFFIYNDSNPFIQTAIVNTSSYYPDNPVWKNNALYYSEYPKDRVMCRDGRGNIELWREKGCGPRSIAVLSDKLLVACHDSASLVEITTRGAVIRRISADRNGHPFGKPLDFSGDALGGIYFTTAASANPDRVLIGRIYYLGIDKNIDPTGISINAPGGMTLAQGNKTLLISERSENRLVQFDVVRPGVLANRRDFIRMSDITAAPDGMDSSAGPDGLSVDTGGNIFICHSGASRILMLDPSGGLLQVIKTALPYVTGITFGRQDNVIYVTSVSSLSEPPYSGAVFEFTRKRTR